MAGRVEEYLENEIIYKQDANCKKMYIVLEGSVVLYRNFNTPKEYVIGACGKGKTFGEMNLFTTDKCLYTAVAFTDVKLAWFEKNNLASFISGYPEEAMKLLDKIGKCYTLLGTNLKMAIDEINVLSEKISNADGKEELILDYDEIQARILGRPDENNSFYKYIGKK